MENQKTTNSQGQSTSTTKLDNSPANIGPELTVLEKSILSVIVDINMVVSYPVDTMMLIRWTKKILELRPETTSSDVKSVIDYFLSGKMKYDRNIGMTNIFLGFEELEREKRRTITPELKKVIDGYFR